MTAEELATALVQVHHLEAGQRYLMFIDHRAVPTGTLQQMLVLLHDKFQIRPILIKTNGPPQDAISVVDLGAPA